jgi:hypothetical protein
MNDINKKNASNQMRTFIGRMRKGYTAANESVTEKKDLNVRDMLKITRKLNEEVSNNPIDKKTAYDQENEEKKLLNYFKDMNVNIRFIPLEVYDNFVFWGGTVDGMIQFVFKVTPNENTSNVEFNYLEDFSPDNPENDEIVNRLEAYYDIFSKFWQENMVQH